MSDWLKKQTIGIIGNGVVGQATARAFLEHVAEVRIWDILHGKTTHLLPKVLACDVVFVCLPTPQKKDSLECDVSVLENFLGSIRHNGGNDETNLVLRSTVPIGYTRRASNNHALRNLVHSPEFLTARCATVDAQMPTRNLIGINDTFYGEGTVGHFVRKLYTERWPHVPCRILSSRETEAVKLFTNAFFAVKVAYWNEVNGLATKLGLDWEAVINAILMDGRIHPSHTQVPGPDGKYGFGGACLVKDLASLVSQLIDNGMSGYKNSRMVTEAAMFRNINDRER